MAAWTLPSSNNPVFMSDIRPGREEEPCIHE